MILNVLNRLALQALAGNAGIDGDDTQNGGGELDAEIAYPYLYQVVNNDVRIAQFCINGDGSLERQLDIEIVDTELFLPRHTHSESENRYYWQLKALTVLVNNA